MKIERFISGSYRQNHQYKSFTPAKVDIEWTWDDPKINVLLEESVRGVASLDAYSMIVPDIDLFLRMHIVKEANTSSKIEGTKTTINQDLLPVENIKAEMRDDWHEVHNYINAMNAAIVELKKLPLSNRLLRNTHAILMRGVRGKNKYPGEFRKSQNWIGGSNLTDAHFIPPHQDDVPELMGDLEKFLHNRESAVPHLIRIAIAHYQFETIHPFCDGNGRIGRLMVPLYLVSNGLLKKPSLYLSDFFERNRQTYYDKLDYPRRANDLSEWVKFFLNGIIETTRNGVTTFDRILALKNKVDQKIVTMNRKASKAQKLILYLYKHPVIQYDDVCRELGITARPANELIGDLIKKRILKEMTGQLRGKTYIFEGYVDIFTQKAQ